MKFPKMEPPPPCSHVLSFGSPLPPLERIKLKFNTLPEPALPPHFTPTPHKNSKFCDFIVL